MDRKDKRLIKEIIILDVIIVAISIFLWIMKGIHIGILISIILFWVSFISIRIIVNKYGIYSYEYTSNSFRNRIIKKLMK